MNDLVVNLDISKIVVSLFAGLLSIVALLVSILWRNLREQLLALKNMSLMVEEKLDTSHKELINTVDVMKLRLKEHDWLLSLIKENNDNLKMQLNQLNVELHSMPEKLMKLINGR